MSLMNNSIRLLRLLILAIAAVSSPIRAAPVEEPASPNSLKDTLAAEQRGDLPAALAGYHFLVTRPQAPHVRAYLHGRVRALVARIPGAQLPGLAAKLGATSPLRQWLILRQAALLTGAGKEQAARKLLGAAKGLDPKYQRRALAAAGDPRRIGALVPLTGRLRGIGQDVLRGMILAAGLARGSRGRFATIVSRDSVKDPAGAAAALARQGVVAAVGVPWSRNARQAAPACQKLGVVLLTGADGMGVPQLGAAIFRAVHSPVQRARALAQYLASTKRVTRVAVLHPPSGYGRRVAKAFAEEAVRRSLVVVGTVAYPRKDPTLYKRFKHLVAQNTQAVFVADSATHLELVAPQLGLAGLQAAPLGRLRRGKGRVLLLSTAEGLRARLVKNVGHSVSGAVLAPGFYADDQDPLLGSFVKAFRKTYKRAPGRYAALGYLSVQRIRSLLVRRAQGRVSLRKALAAPPAAGKKALFDRNGERTDAPRLYRVHGSGIRRIGATP